MRKFFDFSRTPIAVLLIVLMAFGFAACRKNGGKAEVQPDLEDTPEWEADYGLVFDLTAIDPSTVNEKENSTSFVAVAEDGTSMRFEGYGFRVTEDGIVMQPKGVLFSLDYVGKIEGYYFEAEERCDLSSGVAYANSPNPESMTNLAVAMVFGGVANAPVSLTEFDVGFFAAGVDQYCPHSVTFTKLRMNTDPEVPQLFFSDLDPASLAYDWLYGDYGYRIDWKAPLEVGLSAENYALEKIKGLNVLRSDIIAGIDRSSIVTEGTTTFFSSTMSDGTVVRFEGENIRIDDKGVYITPQSSVVSLDAVGKIYGYFATVADREQYEGKRAMLHVGYGYTYSSAKTAVERAEDVHTWGVSCQSADLLDGQYLLPVAVFEPNFFQFGGYSYDEESFYVNSLVACYDPSEKVTKMVEAKLNGDFSGYFMEGDLYDASKESSANLESQQLDFYLILKPDTEVANMENGSTSVWYVPKEFYEVGALKDAQGNVLEKATARISKGCSLELFVGDSVIDLPLNVVERYYGAETMNDLVPYAYPKALGDLHTLVVPVIWADQTEMANDDTLKLFREGIGRVVDEQGNVTDYSVTTDEKFSLSEYYDIASYGKMQITSFLTDWYYSDEKFADVWSHAPDEAYSNRIMDWVRAKYPEMDWSSYDQDGNGYVDSMVILNAGVKEDDFIILSYSGAIHHRATYYGDQAGTQDAPRVNTFTSVGYSWLQNDSRTIIHEFAHGLGLIDYYDVMYSGIDAVGTFDMQSGSYGDWNAYSKLAVGWMDPQIVSGLSVGQSVELTIGSSALTDDVILIPAAGKEYEGPFSEYILLDLFTDDGVNEYDTESGVFDLKDVAGVRISHVNAEMEKRTDTVESIVNLGEFAEYTIGTIHIANNYTGNATGKYNLEVIQNGGKNTFTNPDQSDTLLDRNDLFYAGDTFTAEEYSEFLYEGRMDDGFDFGYVIKIVKIGTDANGIPYATIRITRT